MTFFHIGNQKKLPIENKQSIFYLTWEIELFFEYIEITIYLFTS